MRGTILNGNLEKTVKIIFQISIQNQLSRAVSHGPGIEPNLHVTEESQQISKNIEQLMKEGLKEIINERDGVNVAECRSKIIYNDNNNNNEML